MAEKPRKSLNPFVLFIGNVAVSDGNIPLEFRTIDDVRSWVSEFGEPGVTYQPARIFSETYTPRVVRTLERKQVGADAVDEEAAEQTSEPSPGADFSDDSPFPSERAEPIA